MGRLTSHFDYCELFSCPQRNPELAKVNQCNFFHTTSRDKCHEKAVYDKLREYEDLEEQGLLLKLPCKVGDVVYQITRDIVSEFRIKTFVCDNKTFFFHWECVKGIYKNVVGFHSSRIGVDVFLTKEEAEKALAEMEKDDEID